MSGLENTSQTPREPSPALTQFGFGKAHRLSINFLELTPLREHPPAFSVPYGWGSEQYTSFYLPVHILTHMDLPWLDNPSSAVMHFNFRPQLFTNVVILDFTDKQVTLKEKLLRDVAIEEGKPPSPFSRYASYLDFKRIGEAKPYLEIFKSLAITTEELIGRLEQMGGKPSLRDTVILLRTDWSFEFNRYSSSYNNSTLEGRAAFLCHPYMSRKTVAELVEAGLSALGHDLPSLENPLYYADKGDIHPFAIWSREQFKKEDRQFSKKVFRDVFLKLDSRPPKGEISRYYLKNLDFSSLFSEAAEPVEPGTAHARGRLLVVPIQILRDATGVACEVFFERE